MERVTGLGDEMTLGSNGEKTVARQMKHFTSDWKRGLLEVWEAL